VFGNLIFQKGFHQGQLYGDIGQRKSIPQSPAQSFLMRGFVRGLFGYFSECLAVIVKRRHRQIINAMNKQKL
jgi:hypothetical protein